ncbi:MAG: hypothetical protein LBM93_16075 [Oscillospiraceae bacterium]|jgi:hypothetical protein|nr:hypothetical protein [Oscillospiraceae bacterium]
MKKTIILIITIVTFICTGCKSEIKGKLDVEINTNKNQNISEDFSLTEEEFDSNIIYKALKDKEKYSVKEVSGNELFQTTEGSVIYGYYSEDELKFLEIMYFGETRKSIVSYYFFDDVTQIVKKEFKYSVPIYLEDEYSEDFAEYQTAIRKLFLYGDKLYYFIDNDLPVYISNDEGLYKENMQIALNALNK